LTVTESCRLVFDTEGAARTVVMNVHRMHVRSRNEINILISFYFLFFFLEIEERKELIVPEEENYMVQLDLI
jgi:hypothetical protein